jgi:putative heme transporter
VLGSDDWRGRGEDAWRLLGIGLLATAVFLLALRLRLVVLPLFAGAMIAVLAVPIARRLRRLLPGALAALFAVATLVLGTLGAVAGALAVVVNDTERLGERLADTADMIEEWFVEGPLELDPEEVEEARAELGEEAQERAAEWAEGGGLLAGTVTVLEILAGAVLALVIAFFLVKDHERLGERMLQRWSEPRRPRIRATAQATVQALGGYLRGVVILGTVEGITIGGAVALLASPTYGVPIAVVTFVGAFFPIVGAVVAGILAVAVTLAVAGFIPALIVTVVAILVQQLDNDLLAPLIYGRIIQIHPLSILIAITAGSVLAGIAGAFVAVPLMAMTIAGARAWEEHAESGQGREQD